MSAIVPSPLPLPVRPERAGTSTPLAIGQLIAGSGDLSGLFEGPTATAAIVGKTNAGALIDIGGTRLTLATPLDLPAQGQVTLRLLDATQNSVAVIALADAPEAAASAAGTAAPPTGDAVSIEATIVATVISTQAGTDAPVLAGATGQPASGWPLAPGDRIMFRLLGITPPEQPATTQPTAAPGQGQGPGQGPGQASIADQATAPVPGTGAGTATAPQIAATMTPPGGAPSAAGNTLTGTVVARDAAMTTVETPVGTLALSPKLAADPGALVRLLRLPDPAMRVAAAQPSPLPPLAEWPALDGAMRAVEASSPDLIANLQNALRPTDGTRLATSLLTFLAVLRNPAADPWPTLNATLTKSGRNDLRVALDRDLSQLRALPEDRATGDWQIFALPILDGQTIRPVRLMLQRPPKDDGEAGREAGQRFLVDVDLSRMGVVQVDGRVVRTRFDVVLRTHEPLPEALRTDLTHLFDDTIASGGLTGGLSFRVEQRFAISPEAAAPRPTGVTI